jgi:endonuclease/exonuclease/phosphatase family metal-dependent hydrolase
VSEKKTKFVAPSTGVISNIITHESISLPQRADDSYLRIVSNNILLQSLNSSGDRLGGLRSAFMYYDADIFGLQEVDDLWHNAAKLDQTMKTIGYSMVPINPTDSKYANLEEKDIRNPIYYKTDKFELVDCGYDRYAATEFDNGEYPSSSYTWACLKLKESGKQLIVISTHLVARINHSGATVAQTSKSANTYREESVNELLKVVEGLNEKYPSVPVISVGDYNNNYSSKTYALMGKLFYSARTRAEKRVNMSYHSSGNPIGGEPPEGKAIDHIFYSKTGITAKHFETLVSPYSYAYSDHVPVLMDFILE